MPPKAHGLVRLEAVVPPDGTVGKARVTRSLDRKFGLDESAVKALKEFRFTPGTKDGVLVPVLVSSEIEFTTR